jgi:Permease MlaE
MLQGEWLSRSGSNSLHNHLVRRGAGRIEQTSEPLLRQARVGSCSSSSHSSTALAPVRSASLKLAGAIATFGAHAVVEAVRPPYELREILRHASVRVPLRAAHPHGGRRDRRCALDAHTRLARALRRRGNDSRRPCCCAHSRNRPLITGLLVAGRVGAGIGAEIGAMKVTEQIDALEANAVDAFKYLAVTRIIALMICPRRHCQVNARGDTRLPCCYVAESVKPRPGAVDRRRGTPARAQDVKLACLERYIHSRSSSGRLVTGRCT